MRFGKALKSRFELIRETPIRILAIVIAVIVSLCYGLVTVIAFSEMPEFGERLSCRSSYANRA